MDGVPKDRARNQQPQASNSTRNTAHRQPPYGPYMCFLALNTFLPFISLWLTVPLRLLLPPSGRKVDQKRENT